VIKRINAIYFDPVGSSPEQLRRQVQTDITDWTAIAKSTGIQPQ
jgi:tripartite-type tricarboxylate transporter receptor subunit TctC